MNVVTEEIINGVLEGFSDSDALYQNTLEALETGQPYVLSFLFSENFDAFTLQEKEYLLYLTLVLWESVQRSGLETHQISGEELSQAEEKNWSALQTAKGSSFHEKLDVFFDGYREEDVLAFIEDALSADDDESIVTAEAREHLFVTLKSIADCLVVSSSDHNRQLS